MSKIKAEKKERREKEKEAAELAKLIKQDTTFLISLRDKKK